MDRKPEMITILLVVLHIINLCIVPLLLLGVIRKVKAFMQNRIGAPILQPFYDVAKLLRKSETISYTASWIFNWTPRIGLAVAILAVILVPWAGVLLPKDFASATNFLLLLYLLGFGKFFSLLAAMDTGSSFGGLGASREATLSILVEPTIVISLGVLALNAGNTNLLTIFSSSSNPIIAILVGIALLMAALAELSRMPVDDPTTHLELTMIHEAMILENSGRNLALVELATALRSCIFIGLVSQTLLHAWPAYTNLPLLTHYAVALGGLFAVGAFVAILEGVLVKLSWRSVPHYLTYATVLSIVAALIAVVQE